MRDGRRRKKFSMMKKSGFPSGLAGWVNGSLEKEMQKSRKAAPSLFVFI